MPCPLTKCGSCTRKLARFFPSGWRRRNVSLKRDWRSFGARKKCVNRSRRTVRREMRLGSEGNIRGYFQNTEIRTSLPRRGQGVANSHGGWLLLSRLVTRSTNSWLELWNRRRTVLAGGKGRSDLRTGLLATLWQRASTKVHIATA